MDRRAAGAVAGGNAPRDGKPCAYCKTPGAKKTCEACRSRTYCDRGCQMKDWKREHRGQCKKLQQTNPNEQVTSQKVFTPSNPAAAAEAAGGGGSDGAVTAVAAAGGEGDGSTDEEEEDEFENPCPICLDNEDDATVNRMQAAMCASCGQMFCGACNYRIASTMECPICREPLLRREHEKNFLLHWKLLHDRPPGRYTSPAQAEIARAYATGEGVQRSDVDAAKWYRLAAEKGFCVAQFNLGVLTCSGRGVKQDYTEGRKWFLKAAEQGDVLSQHQLGVLYSNSEYGMLNYRQSRQWWLLAVEQGCGLSQTALGLMYCKGHGVEESEAEARFTDAFWLFQLAVEQGNKEANKYLDFMEQQGQIPVPPPGTAISVVNLTSAAGKQLNNKTGMVVAPPGAGAGVKPERATVMLKDEVTLKSMHARNLHPYPRRF